MEKVKEVEIYLHNNLLNSDTPYQIQEYLMGMD
jgi:hypothetical protein